jgi:hypothetical protein
MLSLFHCSRDTHFIVVDSPDKSKAEGENVAKAVLSESNKVHSCKPCINMPVEQ